MEHYHNLLQFFKYRHLPPQMQGISKKFSVLAHRLVEDTEPNPELDEALRKLLEAKDCAVRASIYETYEENP